MKIDPKKTFFCVAPWEQMYQHLNNVSPCHTNRNSFNFSAGEYLNSDFLKSIKKDLVEGKIPLSCQMCKDREDIGIKSTRQSVMQHKEHYDSDDYKIDTPTVVKRLELRSSNLCNFKCRMCDASSSSEIAKEMKIFGSYIAGAYNGEPIQTTKESLIEELKDISLESVNLLCFTGGEPMLIKKYYDFLDFLIEKKLNEKISIELFTNCSVYNPLFMERLNKFKSINFVMSIDGVGKTAEYQRKGTIWPVVENNIYRFTELKEPYRISFNTAISPYVLLDVSSLANFLMKLYKINPSIGTRCYATITPRALHFENMDIESRKKAIDQINVAVEILNVDNFKVLKKELSDIKRNLIEKEPVDPKGFINYTNKLDIIRKEKFENVFGYVLSYAV